MFRIIRFDNLIKGLVLITIFLSIIVYIGVLSIWSDIGLFKLVTISTIIIALLIYLILSPFVSRLIWKIISHFDKSLYPDLNGTWEGKINLSDTSSISCKAVIRQTLLYTHIDMHTATTKSVTLETTPDIEKGQLKLYYIYRSDPKNPSWGAYNGSTIFDIRRLGNEGIDTLELTGKYYTSRETSGRISIKRVNKDINIDVSYY